MMSLGINSIVTLNIQGIDYRCIIVGISKSEAMNLLKNVDLSKKKCITKYIFFNIKDK